MDEAPLLANLPRWLVIGFSGHRRLSVPDDDVAAAIRSAVQTLNDHFPDRHAAAVCSAAFGGDAIFAEVMQKRGSQIAVILPFPAEEFAKDFSDQPPDVWERSKNIIAEAHHVDVVHRIEADLEGIRGLPAESPECGATDDGINDAPDGSASPSNRTLAYLEATIRTVERCDVLLVLWDEQDGKGLGGTATAVKIARRLGKPVCILNPAKLLEPKIQFPDWPKGKSADLVRFSEAKIFLDEFQQKISKESKRNKKIANNRMTWFVYLHLSASTLGASVLVFNLFETLRWIPAAAELTILLVSLQFLHQREKAYAVWRDGRSIAEVCRTFLATWDIRRRPTLLHQPRAPIPGQADLFRRLRWLRTADRSPLTSFSDTKAAYVKNRVRDQIDYFTEQLATARRWYRVYSVTSRIASAAAIGATIAALAMTFTPWRSAINDPKQASLPMRIFEIVGIVMPLVVTAMTILMISREASRRTRRYKEMREILANSLPSIEATCTWEGLIRAVTEVEEAMLQEIVEWRAFVEYTEHLH